MIKKVIVFLNLVFNHGISPSTIIKNRNALNASHYKNNNNDEK
jgi:hypothetical protein